MSENELTARINTLAREIESGAFPRPAARRILMDTLAAALTRLVGGRKAADVVRAAWHAARA